MLMCRQLDDPLDAIAVHGWNGTWGVLAVGFFSSESLITNSYGLAQDGSTRPYGCFFPGSNGALLAAQIAYALWIAGARTSTAFRVCRRHPTPLEATHLPPNLHLEPL